MAVEYEVTDNTLRINCLNWAIAPSIEDSDATMAVVIDKLLELKDVNRIILAEARENEYNFEQTQMLREIANAYNKILNEDKILSISNIGTRECDKFIPQRFSELQFLILEVLRKDPIGAYVRLNTIINHVNKLLERATPAEQRCHYHYLAHALEPIKKILESTALIQRFIPHITKFRFGNRSMYREFFTPVVRPNFMLTRYMLIPPKEGKPIEKYQIFGNVLVEIFKVPGKVRYVYHITPQEFRLSEEKYTILDSARRYLAARKPTEVEFADPEKARETFLNIGRGLIKDLAKNMNVYLSTKEIEELAAILSRYTAGFGVLELLLADERIQDIFINSPIGTMPIFINHSDFEECETNLIPTREDAEAWATRFRLYSGRPLDEANPVLDTELLVPGGRARVAAITRTLSPEGLAFAFRRHREKPWTFPLFMKAKMFDPLYAGLMSFIIDGGRALLVAGGRGSGKTSVLNAMLLELMRKFRLIIVEDTPELSVKLMRKLGYNIEGLKSRSVITRVETELEPAEALRTALRLGDSALVVGEVRSSLRGDQEVIVIDDGITKRVPISKLENSDFEKIQVPTLDIKKDFRVRLEKLKDFIKHPKRSRFIKILTKTGREVVVTPEHSVFTVNSLKISAVESEKLKIGSKIIIPARLPCGYNNIEFLDLTKILPDFRLEGAREYIRKAIKKLSPKKASKVCDVAEIYMYLTDKTYNTKKGPVARIKVSNFLNLMKEAKIEFSLDDLKIKTITSNSLPARLPINEEFCRLLGYFVSEGYIYGKNYVVIANTNENIIQDIISISQKLFNQTPRLRENKTSLGKSVQIIIGNAPLAFLLKKFDLNKKSYAKRLPDFIFGLNEKKICEFLCGLYAGDGYFNGVRVEYATTSKNLANDLSYLLLTLGIVARIKIKKQNKDSRGKRILYNVEFSRKEDISKFLEKVKFTNKSLKEKVKGLEISTHNVLEFTTEELKEHLGKLPYRFSHLKQDLRCSKFYLKKIVNEVKSSEYLKNFANGDFYVDEVKTIEELRLSESEHVYDLSVNPTENFIGGLGGILLHNTESVALFEAMRIGSLANVVAGTIHGESAYGVFDRVVHDLGVVPTSFKALDLITICNMLKSPDGLRRFRRVIELTEVRKKWKQDPLDEGGFVPLMQYSAKEDRLKPTDVLTDGESEVLNEIAKRVREWHGAWDLVWDNILLRAKIKETMVDYSNKLNRPEILEADWVTDSNEMFHTISESVKEEVGSLDSKMIFDEWLEWLKGRLRV